MFGSALSDLLTGSGNKRERPDFRQSFFLALAKVLGAAAWIDGPINQAEVNVVKGLLNELSPRLTTRELQPVQRYLAEPVPREHWTELLAQLSEFTRRRARLQFALERLQALLSADGAPTREESELYHQAQTLLGWRALERGPALAGAEGNEQASGGDAPDPAAAEPESANQRDRAPGKATAVPSAGSAPAAASADTEPGSTEGGIRLGDLNPERRTVGSPPFVDRVLAASAARLSAPGGGGPPPRKLAVVAAALAYVSMRRAGTEREDAELVGFAAAVSGVDDAAAEAVLEAAREQPATGAELAELGAELSVLTSPVEIAALAKLLNAMADGEAALRRLREIGGIRG